MNSALNSSIVVITGGTGSFGSTITRDLLASDVSEVRIFSRDENKQDLMRSEFQDERIKFYIGDVRDRQSVNNVLRGANFVFHAAALKQVPSCEFFPMQAVETNVIGSSNVIESSIANGVESVVCLSTDKAVYPINAMGMSKALMEKVAQSQARSHNESRTRISITRYGNVMMSRGSVIPLFIRQIRAGIPITITDPNMTRFMMSLNDSIELVKYAFTNSQNGDLFVKKAPACTVKTLVEALLLVEEVTTPHEIRIIGTRHGEKLYESLLGTEEKSRSLDRMEYFQVPLDTRSLDYEIYFEKGTEKLSAEESYTSHNARQMNVEETAKLIAELPEYKKLAKAKNV
jgi:UDP-N-acetylglucosamine 4,6-dehydratase